MGAHPINLAIRFILELCALFAMGMWGWRLSDGWPRFLLALVIPVVAAAAWGTFAVPDDPSRSGGAPIPVSGTVRLLLEVAIFGVGAWALWAVGYPQWGASFAIVVILHYAISYDRIVWLLGQ